MEKTRFRIKVKLSGHLLLISILALFGGLIPQPAKSQSAQNNLYLPMIVAINLPFTPNEQELKIAELLGTTPEQQRVELRYNEILSKVARQRAQDMAERGYIAHINPDGVGPNYLVHQAGYELPAFYPVVPDANNIESIAAGQPTTQQAWDSWMNSPHHRSHLLGIDPFYAAQVDYGIGYVYKADSPYVAYWVIITAQPGP